MVRFFMKCTFKNEHNGCEGTEFYSVDSIIDLEHRLRKGGMSESGYERHELIGAEVIDDE